MAIKDPSNAWSTPSARVKPTDLNDTVAWLIESAILSSAISNYKILQANNVFENGDLSFVDEFVDSNGTNNTVNTSSSTARYDSINARYTLQREEQYINSGGSGYTGTKSFTGAINANGIFSRIQITNGTATSFIINIKKNGTTVCTKNSGAISSSQVVVFNLTSADYSQELANGDTYIIECVPTGGYVWNSSGTYAGSLFTVTSGDVLYGQYTFTETPASSGTVIHDANTYTLDGSEYGLIIYTKNEVPANTSISYDITDGTTTLSNQNAEEYIDISSLSSGTLEITENLATTDSTATPKSYGISVVIIK